MKHEMLVLSVWIQTDGLPGPPFQALLVPLIDDTKKPKAQEPKELPIPKGFEIDTRQPLRYCLAALVAAVIEENRLVPVQGMPPLAASNPEAKMAGMYECFVRRELPVFTDGT